MTEIENMSAYLDYHSRPRPYGHEDERSGSGTVVVVVVVVLSICLLGLLLWWPDWYGAASRCRPPSSFGEEEEEEHYVEESASPIERFEAPKPKANTNHGTGSLTNKTQTPKGAADQTFGPRNAVRAAVPKIDHVVNQTIANIIDQRVNKRTKKGEPEQYKEPDPPKEGTKKKKSSDISVVKMHAI